MNSGMKSDIFINNKIEDAKTQIKEEILRFQLKLRLRLALFPTRTVVSKNSSVLLKYNFKTDLRLLIDNTKSTSRIHQYFFKTCISLQE